MCERAARVVSSVERAARSSVRSAEQQGASQRPMDGLDGPPVEWRFQLTNRRGGAPGRSVPRKRDPNGRISFHVHCFRREQGPEWANPESTMVREGGKEKSSARC